MYVYLSKILPLFVLPLGIVFTLGFVGLFLLKWDHRRIATAVFLLAGAVLWISSMQAVADSLFRYIESTHPARPVASLPQGDCIVMLGGAVSPPLPPRVDVEFSSAVDRVFKTLELYQAGKARLVIISAGNQPWMDQQWTEAELVRNFLVERGVPENAVLIEGSSRNTRENAMYSRNIMNSVGCETALLVTSAAHMPRSVAAFRNVGVSVVPVSTDIRVINNRMLVAMDFLPSASALSMTTDGLRELLGRWFYEFQGWN